MKITSLAFSLLLLATTALQAQTPAPATTPAAPAVVLPPQPPDVPAEKYGKDGKINPGFIAAHEKFVNIAKEGKAQLVFLGDSITAGWAGNGKQVWAKSFSQYTPANFGIGGDRTQHVLWRIKNGELEGIKPKACVLMIGTNNVASDPAEGIAKGVTAIVETIREKQPQAKILLLAVFPRGDKPTGKLGTANEKLKQVNAIISKLDDGKNVFFLDIGSKFPQPDGALTKEVMPDFLHLSPTGYQIWADAISPKLAELMK
ncbi:platelet-activating factor acetylhydrolase IB subunit [Prosthecobacter vanneervenii]|uniref:Lysophospholipase L1-like esterase n=1 Tax=Prosthecobacter vanneervenii TaxID=48466 RepID=A0A7W7YFC1_9BACT|nr:platelet-activating factor acetylhydrolase IB subunit [Prosthecobacter vanneervenii]MBB5035146.1 lysophospholipase L1-like esterase [Prosthecobacter vanneervenii]